MDKQSFQAALKAAKDSSKKRNFTQSVDLIINLKNLNLKKENENLSFYCMLPYERGKSVKVAALVGPELSVKAKKVCDYTIINDDFKSLEKKAIKKLADQYDYFIAQANIMSQVAGTFGKILGPRGKMPSPKAGAVVPPVIDLQPVVEKLKRTVKLETKNELTVKTSVGTEVMDEDQVVENALVVYNAVMSHLPQEKNNLKSVVLKLTMGKPVMIGEKGTPEVKDENEEKKKQEPKKEQDTIVKKEPVSEEKKEVKEKKKPVKKPSEKKAKKK